MPDDPRCPVCGRKVGTYATSCLHCGATFDEPEGTTAQEGQDFRADGTADSSGSSNPVARDVERLVEFVSMQVYLLTYTRKETPGYPSVFEVCRRAGAFVDAADHRRDGLALGIGLVTTVGLFLLTALRPEVGLLAGFTLTVYLFTRETAVETVTAAAYGAGLVLVGIGTVHGSLVVTTDRVISPIQAGIRLAVPVAVGTVLIAGGRWLDNRHTEPPSVRDQ